MRKEARLGDIIATRPTDARKRIYSAFEGQDCLKCGRCCRKDKAEPFRLTFLANDPALAPVRKKISEAATGRKVAFSGIRDNAVIVRSSGPDCVFVETETNRCDIYADRPITCKAFPFTAVESKTVVFSTLCPPILELQKRDIHFLYMSDITLPLGDALMDMHSYPMDIQAGIVNLVRRDTPLDAEIVTIRFLANCLGGLADMLKASREGLPEPLVVGLDESRKEGVFPIW